ncbi:uncharacterized protein LOC111055800 isoform X2 [Nilaparvata lugens]|nr:uncharacterized protein LOC111055800 isoform X2 [Nilaparvata lugens]XP_039292256.1 uncharacterized protein LOC111055800 isoform X2 [Nilaparvata lugens]
MIISLVQVISIAFGEQKDRMDGFYNVFLMVLYAISLNSLMNILTPEDYDTPAWYRIITESITSAVAFLLHFFEIILTWIKSELGMEPSHATNRQSRSKLNRFIHTRAGHMRVSRYTQTYKEVSFYDIPLVDNNEKSLDHIEVSNPTSQGDEILSTNHKFENDSSWIKEIVLVDLLSPWNNDKGEL